MQVSRKLLHPIKRENYDAAFSKAHNAELLEIATYFEASISHFKRFAIGNYFWFLADVTRGGILEAGGQIEALTAIKMADFTHNSPELLFNRAHPEDLTHLFAFTNYWVSFITNTPAHKRNLYYPTIYIRLRNIDDLYKWCMVQYSDRLTEENGNILVGLTVVTDISHIKTEGPAMMSIIDVENEHCQHFYCQADNQLIESTKEILKLSIREIEVLNLLSIGMSSKQIAYELNLSIKTVDNHRQNMLHKTQSKSSGELITFAIKTGYL